MKKFNEVNVRIKSLDALNNWISLLVFVSTLIITNLLNNSIELGINIFMGITNLCILIMGTFTVKNAYILKFCCDNTKIANKLIFPLILFIVGSLELIVQYFTMDKRLHGVHHILTSLVIIPIMIFFGLKYLGDLNERYGTIKNYAIAHLTLSKIQIFSSVSISYLFFHWCSYTRDNFSTYSLLLNIIYDWITMILALIIMTYGFLSLKYLMKDENRNLPKRFEDVFPYGFFYSVFCFLICWGSIVYVLKEFTLESSYYVTALITIIAMTIYAVMIHWGIGAKVKGKDKIKLGFLSVSLMCYSLLIYTKVIQQSKSIPKNSFGILIAAILLLLFVVIIIKSDNNESD